jgi:hypothetical protein
MKLLTVSLLAVALLLSVGCATQKTSTGGVPAPPKISPAKVSALEGIACNLGKNLVPNLSAADATKVTNGCAALETATANWQIGKGTLAEVLQGANDLDSIWKAIGAGNPSLNQKIDEITAAVEAIIVVLS